MYINLYYIDECSKTGNITHEVECGTLQEVIEAIKMLDGENRTMIIFTGDGDTSLTVTGGGEGIYSVCHTLGIDQEFHTLVDPEKRHAQSFVKLISGCQSVNRSAEQCVSFAATCEAATHFAKDGSMSPFLVWKNA